MAMNTGELENRAEVFDCFVQFMSGSNLYRLKHLQRASVTYSFPKSDVANDEGDKARARQLPSNRVGLDLNLTADDFDTVNPPTDEKTISWFLYKKFQKEDVTVVVKQVFVTKNSGNNYVRNDFDFDLEDIGIARNNGDGTVGLSIAGEILLKPNTPTFLLEETPADT